ncbi:hypothetical protein RSAG8_03548, partial [Rhizoctonia solani AG-8 WAC10335]
MHSRSRSVSGPGMKRTEDEVQRAIDSETDANTEFNAAKLSANIRPRSASVDKKKKKKTSKEEKARRRAVADQARRERRRTAGLDSDTTQGEDSDSEYVTGHGNGTGHKPSAMPPAHPNGYPYAPYGQPNPYSQRSPYSADPYPSLFASTHPTMLDPEEMARRKLEQNPLPTLPRGHRSQPAPSNSLPGGYAPPTGEKSRSKHSKSASTGTLPQPTYPSGPPVPPKSKSRRDKSEGKSQSRSRPGWEAEGVMDDLHGVPVLDARGIPIANAPGHAHAHAHSQSVPIIIRQDPRTIRRHDQHTIRHEQHTLRHDERTIPRRDADPIVLQDEPATVVHGHHLERTSSRGNKWGNKIAGLFGRGRRGSNASLAVPDGRHPPLADGRYAPDGRETRHGSIDTGRYPTDLNRYPTDPSRYPTDPNRYPTDAPSSAP